MKPLVELFRISKSFPGVQALADIDLALRPGSIHALVGENGAGKSTLIHILSGVLQADNGAIHLAGRPVRLGDAQAARRLGVVTVHQEVDLFPDLTVAENIGHEQGLARNRLGWINWSRQRRQTQAALSAVGEAISPALRAGALSPGQRQLIEIAAAVSQEAPVLILDEPTSSLSEAETRRLFRQLRQFRGRGSAVLYVSHRLEEIFALADEVTVLRNGRRVWTGPIADSSIPQLIQAMVGRNVQATARAVRQEPGPVRFRCQDLTARDKAFTNISLAVHAGEIFGLYGLIGAGRSEWAQAVFGLRQLARGTIAVDGQQVSPQSPAHMIQQGLIYVPEDRLRQGLCRGLSVRANLVLASLRQLGRSLWLPQALERKQARQRVEQLAIGLWSIEQAAGTLSGGNQQKVVLGRWLSCDPKVLVLDEPTRGVDVSSKAEIHALIQRLAAEGRALVVISSDLPEILTLCDHVGVFRRGRLVASFDPRTASAADITAAAIPTGQLVADGEAKVEDRRAEIDDRGGTTLQCQGPLVSDRSALFDLPSSFLGRWRESALLVIVVFLVALQWKNLSNVATDAALLSFCAIGTTLVILAGGIDISLGDLMVLSAGVAGRFWEQGYPWPVVAGVAVLLGGIGGLVNAGLSLLGRVHPIVITLGTMNIYRGLTLWWLQQDVQVPGYSRNWIFHHIGGIPLITWLGMVLVVLVGLVLNWTVPGRELYALGSNPAAAHRVGIGRGRVWLGAFTIQGTLLGLAGFLYLARSGSLQPTSFDNKTLEAIAAAVVGGVAITGGRGSVWGVLLGCLFLVSLAPACLFLGISTHWQRTLVGSVIVVAVLTDRFWRRKEQ